MADGYSHAAAALDRVWAGRGSIKEAVLGKHNDRLSNKQRRFAYALVCQTLKFNEALDAVVGEALPPELLDEAAAAGEERTLRRSLAYVMIYDLVFSGRRKVDGGGWAKRALLQHEPALSAAAERLVAAHRPPGHKGGRPTKSELKLLIPAALRDGPTLPRYARVNPLRTTMREALDALRAEGWEVGAAPGPTSEAFAAGPPPRAVWLDPHVPTLLSFPHGTDLHDHQLVVQGGLLLQDKASCFPATAMLPTAAAAAATTADGANAAQEAAGGAEPDDWIDACAAPGNKTMHLTGLLAAHRARAAEAREGRVFAFERSPKRVETLRTRLAAGGAGERVSVVHGDWLESDPADPAYSRVVGVLVDPSCSGSGMTAQAALDQAIGGRGRKRKGPESDAPAPAERLEQLASFQVAAVLHAMRFPRVRRVVYSTCSIHREENEDVVAAILAGQPDATHRFEVAEAMVEAAWPRRGAEETGYPWREKVIRCQPGEDRTHGFFVAVFERTACADDPSPQPLPLPMRAVGGAPVAEGAPGTGSARTRRDNKRKRRKKKRQKAEAQAALLTGLAGGEEKGGAEKPAMQSQ